MTMSFQDRGYATRSFWAGLRKHLVTYRSSVECGHNVVLNSMLASSTWRKIGGRRGGLFLVEDTVDGTRVLLG